MSYERLSTPNGPIHVWTPPNARRKRGTVVYAHGLYNNADEAVEKHRLVEQFANSGVDATFIVPEVPWKGGQSVQFPDLGALLRLVEQCTKLGSGPIILIGHSAAHLTLRKWLKNGPPVQHVILLDALYDGSSEFRAWAGGWSTRRLTVIGQATNAASKDLVESMGGTYLPSIPAVLSRDPRDKVLGAESQYGHNAIVEDGIVIPIVLRRTALTEVGSGWLPWVAGLLTVGAAGLGGWYYYERRRRLR